MSLASQQRSHGNSTKCEPTPDRIRELYAFLLEFERRPSCCEVHVSRAVLGAGICFIAELLGDEERLRQTLGTAENDTQALDVAPVYRDLSEVLRIRRRIEDTLDAAFACDGSSVPAKRAFSTAVRIGLVVELLRVGQWNEVARRLEELSHQPLGPADEMLLSIIAGRLHTARGDLETARAYFEHAMVSCHGVESTRVAAALYAGYAELDLWRGLLDSAHRRIVEGLQEIASEGAIDHLALLCSMGARVEADRAEYAHACGDAQEAEQARQVAKEHLKRLTTQFAAAGGPIDIEAHLANCRAETARAAHCSAPELWGDAAVLWGRAGDLYATAYSSYRQAEALLLSGAGRSRARRILREVSVTSANLEAQPLNVEITALARRARLSVLDAEDAVRGAVGLKGDSISRRLGLTKRELEVLTLIGGGFTNREISQQLFISPHTAGVHVSHILAKLGVANRVLAAAKAHRLGITVSS
jgi:ATP/maltotriose-dependent transcriptional regulator MalT